MKIINIEKRKFVNALFSLLTALSVVSGFTALAEAELNFKANHDHIKMDFFYHGSTVSVKGQTEPGTDLVIKIASAESEQTLRKKGKAGGVLWMNVGELHFRNAPNLYFIHSTGELDNILSRDEMAKYGLGYKALADHIYIEPLDNADEKNAWFGEFVKYKESSRLYTTSHGRIEMLDNDGKTDFSIICDWPYQAPAGDYTVTVYSVKDGKVIAKSEAGVVVEKVGVIKSLFDMAENKGGFYGAISILAALGAGFGVGMVFGKGGGAH